MVNNSPKAVNSARSPKCRICKTNTLSLVLDLGVQPLSGVFLDSLDSPSDNVPLQLYHCDSCELVQLGYIAPLASMYGENYGYRSGLNPTMVRHLEQVYNFITNHMRISDELSVIDIGSNDGTFLANFNSEFTRKTGIDPSAEKFRQFYPDDTELIVDFFSKDAIRRKSVPAPNLVSSIAMFYDLEDPIKFAQDIYDVLLDDGYWYVEVCYGPWIAQMCAFDTICHEHIEYYSVSNLKDIFDQIGFRIISTHISSSNGFSIGVLTQKNIDGDDFNSNSDPVFSWFLENEKSKFTNSAEAWISAAESIERKRNSTKELLLNLQADGKSIFGMGASTKGNILLNYLGLDSSVISAIGEVNTSKYGKFTPGSLIPIIPEDEVLKTNPDYILFLPWHFRTFAIKKYEDYLNLGGQIIFPLPELEIYKHGS